MQEQKKKKSQAEREAQTVYSCLGKTALQRQQGDAKKEFALFYQRQSPNLKLKMLKSFKSGHI